MLLNSYRFSDGGEPDPITDPDVLALLARMTVQPNSSLRLRINDLYLGLKSNGILAKLDSLYIAKGLHTFQAALLDWKRTSINGVSYNGASWSKGAGFEGDGTLAYIDTLFTPSVDGVNFTLNNFGAGCYISEINDASGSTNYLFGARQSISKYFSMSVNTNEKINVESCGGVTLSSPTLSSYNGHHCLNRTTSNNVEVFRNTISLVSSSSNAVVGLPAFSVYLLASNVGSLDSPSKVKIGYWYAGAPLTTIEQTIFNQLLDNFWLPDFATDTVTFNYSSTLLEIGRVVINPIEYFSFPVPTFTTVNYI